MSLLRFLRGIRASPLRWVFRCGVCGTGKTVPYEGVSISSPAILTAGASPPALRVSDTASSRRIIHTAGVLPLSVTACAVPPLPRGARQARHALRRCKTIAAQLNFECRCVHCTPATDAKRRNLLLNPTSPTDAKLLYCPSKKQKSKAAAPGGTAAPQKRGKNQEKSDLSTSLSATL